MLLLMPTTIHMIMDLNIFPLFQCVWLMKVCLATISSDSESLSLNILSVIHNLICINTVARFQFSQTSYTVSESSGVVMICVVLTNGTLNEANFSLSKDITIKLNNQAGNAEVTAMCKYYYT